LTWVRIGFWTLFLAACAAFLAESYHKRFESENQLAVEEAKARNEAAYIQQTVILFSQHTVPSGRPLASFLIGLGIDPQTVPRLIAATQGVFNLRLLRAGNQLTIGRSVLGDLRQVRYRIDTDHVLSIAPSGDDFRSEIQTIPSRTETAGVAGTVRGSLFQSVIRSGLLHRCAPRRHVPRCRRKENPLRRRARFLRPRSRR
jgi:hypothetical protein